MNRLLILVAFCLMQCAVAAQVPDYVSVRRVNGRTVKNFMKGLPITLETKAGSWIDGWISDMRHDSIIVKTYIVRTVMTHLGVTMLDTLGSVQQPVHHKDIDRIKITQRQSFLLRRTDDLLFIGGVGYLLLHISNGAYLSESITGKNNLRRLSIAAGVTGVGLLWHKLLGPTPFTTRKHRIVYVNMQRNTKPL